MLRVVNRAPKSVSSQNKAGRLVISAAGNNVATIPVLWNQQQRPFFAKIAQIRDHIRYGNGGVRTDSMVDPNTVLAHLRSTSKVNPKECIDQINSGWQNGKLPASEEIIKEYLKAAASLNKLDTLDVAGLLALTQKGNGGIAGANGTITPEAFYAALNASKSTAGTKQSDPIYFKRKHFQLSKLIELEQSFLFSNFCLV